MWNSVRHSPKRAPSARKSEREVLSLKQLVCLTRSFCSRWQAALAALILVLITTGSGSASTIPTAPTGLDAQVSATDTAYPIHLTWNDTSTNEQRFELRVW